MWVVVIVERQPLFKSMGKGSDAMTFIGPYYLFFEGSHKPLSVRIAFGIVVAGGSEGNAHVLGSFDKLV